MNNKLCMCKILDVRVKYKQTHTHTHKIITVAKPSKEAAKIPPITK